MTTYYVDMSLGNDANAGTSEGSGNAWKTIQKAADTATAGDKVWIKASADYTEQVDFDTQTGTVASWISFEGYTTTTGDNGRITWTGSSSRSYCLVSNGTPKFISIANVDFKGATSSPLRITTATGYHWHFENCYYTGGSTLVTNASYATWQNVCFVRCKIYGFTSHGVPNSIFIRNTLWSQCAVLNNGSKGFYFSSYPYSLAIVRCLIAGNTGDGIDIGSYHSGTIISECTVANNGGHGITIGTVGTLNVVRIVGNLIANQTAGSKVGLRLSADPTNDDNIYCAYNAFYNNTSHRSGYGTTGYGDITLSTDPFTNAAGGNWGLNNNNPGGAELRATLGPPFDGTTVGYADYGAVQHQDTGGGSGGGPLVGPGRLIRN